MTNYDIIGDVHGHAEALNKVARLLGVAPKTLRLPAEAGDIEGVS